MTRDKFDRHRVDRIMPPRVPTSLYLTTPFHLLVAVLLVVAAFTPAEAATLVQSTAVSGNGSKTLTAPLGSPPTPGNLLVGCLGSRGMISTLPGGWASAVTVDNPTEADRLQIMYKIAGLNEPSAVTVTGLTAEGHVLSIAEFTGIAGVPLDVTASTGRTPGVTSIASGTTAATAQADALSIVCSHARNNIIPPTPAWSGGVTTLHNGIATTPNTVEIVSGYRVETVQGTKAYTMGPWTTSTTAMGAIAVFKGGGMP